MSKTLRNSGSDRRFKLARRKLIAEAEAEGEGLDFDGETDEELGLVLDNDDEYMAMLFRQEYEDMQDYEEALAEGGLAQPTLLGFDNAEPFDKWEEYTLFGNHEDRPTE